MYQCGWCWLYIRRYVELCPFCGCESVVMVTEEDFLDFGYICDNESYRKHSVKYVKNP